MNKKLFTAVLLMIVVTMCSCAQGPKTVTHTITNTETSLIEIEKPLVITSTYVLEHPVTQTITVTAPARTDYLIREVTVTSTYKTTVIKTYTEYVY